MTASKSRNSELAASIKDELSRWPKSKEVDVRFTRDELNMIVDLLTRSESASAQKPDPVADLCEQIKKDIRYCDHGYIYITCGQCVAAWLRGQQHNVDYTR